MPFDIDPKDIDALLAPISTEHPAGVSLRYAGVYEKAREARRSDDPTLPQGEWQTELKRADFRALASLCSDALAHQSKDLQLAIWLVEAWTELHGIRGLTSGLTVLCTLCNRYWDTMFPELAEGADERLSLLDWLDDALRLRLRVTPLTGEASAAPFSLGEWELARGRVGKEADDGPTWETVLVAMTQSGRVHWQALHADVEAAARARERVVDALGRHGATAVLRRTGDTLTAIAGVTEHALRSLGVDPAPAIPSARIEGQEAAQPVGSSSTWSSPIHTRAEAYARLTEAADFLLRTEPHSPVPYLVMRAVAWGNMPLGELLREFVGQTDDLVSIQVLLGMRRRED